MGLYNIPPCYSTHAFEIVGPGVFLTAFYLINRTPTKLDPWLCYTYLDTSIDTPISGASQSVPPDSKPCTTCCPAYSRSRSGITKRPCKDYSFFSDGTVRYGFSAATNEEPYNLQAALSDQNWKAAMESEISALVRNKTWTLILVPPAPDGNLFDCKWVY